MPGVRWLAQARPALRRVEGRLATAQGPRRGYDLLFNGIEVERFAKATPTPTAGPTIFFVGRHEDRKGLAVLLGALRLLPPEVRWVGGTGPRPRRSGPRTAATPAYGWDG